MRSSATADLTLLATIDEFDPTFLTDLVGHIYEAAVDPDHWDEFLTILERVYPGSRVTLFGHENGRPSETLTRYKNFAPDDLRAYVDYYVTNSPYIARGRTLPVGQATHYEVMVDEKELKATEHYNDFVRPRRLGYWGTGVVIERCPERATALSLADHQNDPDRRARQLRLIDALVPHLVRAFRLQRMVAAQQATGDAAQAAFDRWAHAAFVLNAGGRVVVMNSAAETLLGRADGLSLGRDGRLRGVDEVKTGMLDLAIRKCVAMCSAVDAEARSVDLDGLVLPRPSGAAPLRAMISPLPFLGGAATSQLGPGTVLLLIFDADNIQRTPVDWIARQFGLTPSEQRLTEAIINGEPLADAAEQLGIRLSTARTRLKTIQTKTHCHRQVDLVRLALSLPALRSE
jgi:DNA-binding CsgD family transcriptional regulator/PAS domain-containing protein